MVAWCYTSCRGGTPANSKTQLMRAPITSGLSHPVLTEDIGVTFRCSKFPTSLCALTEPSSDHQQLVFTAFDSVKGRGHELTRIDSDPQSQYPGTFLRRALALLSSIVLADNFVFCP